MEKKILNRKVKMKGFSESAVLLGILLLAASAAADVSLGSTSDKTTLNLAPGAYGVFSASFFNMGSETLAVDFELEYPSDMQAEVVPSSLQLGTDLSSTPTSDGEWLILDGGRRYVKTYPVKLYVKIPSTISRNTYFVKLVAKARSSSSSDSSGFSQSIVQVREITFKANVPGSVNRNVETTIVRMDAGSGAKISFDAEESFKQSSGSSSSPFLDTSSSSSGGDYSSTTPEEIDISKQGSFGISKDPVGNTNIDLPTGKVSLSEGQTDAAIDLGLVTLIISIGSLVVRILR